MQDDHAILKERYEEIAKTGDYDTTACDYNLRELEIDTAIEYMRPGDLVLDVGCGLGYAASKYALREQVTVHAIDYAENMIGGANDLLRENHPELLDRVTFQVASVMELPFESNTFDVVSSSRCLMALLEWDRQKAALREIHRVLKPGGMLVLMEGTMDGIERLNKVRMEFGLDAIAADGRDRLFTRKFRESELLDFCRAYYTVERVKRFGMYYFLTRVVQPLLVAPEKPSYAHPLNHVALEIARQYPNYMDLGHLTAFTLVKHRAGDGDTK